MGGTKLDTKGERKLEKKLEKKRKKKSIEEVDNTAEEVVVEAETPDDVKRQKVLPGVEEAIAATDEKLTKKKEKKLKKSKDKGSDEPEEVIHPTPSGDHETPPRKKDKKLKKQHDHPKAGSAVSEGVIHSAASESGGLAVTVSGSGCDNPKFKPLTTFDVPGVPENVLACCKKFEKPSPIQAHAWPFLLAGRDLIGIARTGSGKTLAFGVPAIVHVSSKKVKSKKPCPLALVLAPTRELTQQIAEVLEEAGGFCGVKVACVYGGASKGPQKEALRAGGTIVVATPGRLQDLLDEGVCSLDQVSFVVLDEADRMLDLGFEPAIRAIIKLTSASRQTLMFSATWPVSVDKLGKEFMQDSTKIVKVTVGSEDLAANHDVTQIVEVVDDKDKSRRLESLLQKYHKSRTNRVIVFVLYKKEAARVESLLQSRGWKAVSIHGDKGQNDRTQAVQSFKDGTCPLLVATDVAARGLDIPDVEYVINFSFPLTVEDYVHRIGRTGRAGKKGIAHTFFTQADKVRAGELVNVLTEAGQNVPEDLLKFGTHVKKKESALYGAHFKEISANAKQATKITFDASDDDE
ncbi:unnamed protein product [Calypogeia fissa]